MKKKEGAETVSKDLWQTEKEQQCRDMKWDGASDCAGLGGSGRASHSSLSAQCKGFIVMHAVCEHTAVPHLPATPLSVSKTITSH